jgi:hypothetical protein
MSRSTKAVLLSALVFPGAGHLYLKYFWRGIALVGVSLACMGVIAEEAMRQTSAALDKLVSEGGALDPNQLSDLLTQASSSSDSGVASVAMLVLTGCWLVGIVDAYRLGRHQSGRPR